MTIIRSGRRTEAEGQFEIQRGAQARHLWSEVTVRVFDASGQPTDIATGVIRGSTLKSGSGRYQDFTQTLDLAIDDWSWLAELSFVQTFRFSILGLNAGYEYEISVNSGS